MMRVMNNRHPCGMRCRLCRERLVARNTADMAARSESKAPVNATREGTPVRAAAYPPGYYDLTRLTGKNLPSVEPGRRWA